jgi:hypothetical protein
MEYKDKFRKEIKYPIYDILTENKYPEDKVNDSITFVMITVVVMSTTTITLLLDPLTAYAASSGWSNGYARGTYGYANGNAFNDHCSFAYSNSYCFDYRLGYNAGWIATKISH